MLRDHKKIKMAENKSNFIRLGNSIVNPMEIKSLVIESYKYTYPDTHPNSRILGMRTIQKYKIVSDQGTTILSEICSYRKAANSLDNLLLQLQK